MFNGGVIFLRVIAAAVFCGWLWIVVSILLAPAAEQICMETQSRSTCVHTLR